MRAIAESAGVSASSAYYYFPSKTHLVQDLYVQVQQAHAALARPALADATGFVDRLRIVFETGLEAVAPYHHVAPGFLTAMVSPESPLNPLSAASETPRAMTIELFREAVDGAQHRLPSDITAQLPAALFVGYLALVLRWSYDRPEDKKQTYRLLDAGLRLLAVALPFTRVPGIRSVTRDALALVAEVRP